MLGTNDIDVSLRYLIVGDARLNTPHVASYVSCNPSTKQLGVNAAPTSTHCPTSVAVLQPPQIAVEEYFTSSGALPVAVYWLGANRSTKAKPFTWLDNTTIGIVPNDDPYIHWNWFFPNRRILEYHCALAR